MGGRAVDAVFLDVGGVFHLPDHRAVLEGLARAGLSVEPGRLDRCHFAGAASLRLPGGALPTGGDPDDEVWRTYQEGYVRELGVAEELVVPAVLELSRVFSRPGVWSRPIPGTGEALAALARTGAALAVVSNSDGTLEGRLRQEGLCQVGQGPGVPVVAVVDSGAVGVSKPDPAIFGIALRATGVPAERTVHVGDTLALDVAGALAAGIEPWHLDPHGFCGGDTHRHFRSLGEVATAVAGSRGS